MSDRHAKYQQNTLIMKMLKEITAFLLFGNLIPNDQKCNLSTKDCIEPEYFPTIINILGRIVSNIVWNCLSSVLRREKMRIKPAIRIKWSERDSFMREEREGQINTAVTVNGSLHCGGLRTHFLDFDLHHISLTLHISYRFSVAHIKGDAQFIVFITNHLEGSTLMTNLYYFDFIFIFLCGIKH